jgi:ribose 1,5-bisphosphokinase PhnN
MVGDKSLADIKQAQTAKKEYKPTEKEAIGIRLLQSKNITSADVQTLLNSGEYGDLKYDDNGNAFVEYYAKAPTFNEKNEIVYTPTPAKIESLNDFLAARTNNLEFKKKSYSRKKSPGADQKASPDEDEFEEYKRDK